MLVIAGVANAAPRQRQHRRVAAFLGPHQRRAGLLGIRKAGAAEHHHGVLNALLLLIEVGLEHLQLEADAARFAPQQKLRVRKSQTVGVGLQRCGVVG